MTEPSTRKRKLSRSELEELLPWYASSTLQQDEIYAVEAGLSEYPDLKEVLEDWEQVRSALKTRPSFIPADSVWSSLSERLSAPNRAPRIYTGNPLAWWVGIALALMVLVGLWWAIQPGIVLEWTVSGQPAETYRIYRAVSGEVDFELIHELSAEDNTVQYRYVDALLIPGRSYSYRVEGVGNVGSLAVSQMVTMPPLAALPGQLAVIFTSLATGYCAAMLLRLWPLTLTGHRPGLWV